MPTANSSSVLISTIPKLKDFVSTISASSTLYVDLEGKSLGRYRGTICIISILVYPEQVVRLVDVTTLGKAAFSTTGTNGKTIKSILEDSSIVKCIWDCHNDAAALLALYQISINGVSDIQLLENATRAGNKSHFCGLAKAIETDLKLKHTDRALWTATKNAVTAKMSTNVFAKRPMDDETVRYCVNDLVHLPALRALYLSRLEGGWAAQVEDATKNRLRKAQSSRYKPQSEDKRFGPFLQPFRNRKSTVALKSKKNPNDLLRKPRLCSSSQKKPSISTGMPGVYSQPRNASRKFCSYQISRTNNKIFSRQTFANMSMLVREMLRKVVK
ncbi:hypothetical protein BLS_001072 [Venturia inaequalis]|uniref:3'-5' exonuclease domain-containing protein n=1 Tax=Venturia inaequalis TaxID=5025 RepID=A0A8H3U2P8_VENIN|nr:hypothetical protein BLS_001072 [Venturia inaequalis]KAE9981821.1 hypothetical protein EG328_011414 [Venturia inaequalis]